MKAILILTVLCASAFADFQLQTGADLVKYRDECVTSLGIEEASVAQFKQWKFEDPKSAEYIKCIFEKMHLFADGNFNVDNLATQLSHGEPTDELKTKVQGCINDSLEGAEKVFQGFNCFKENNLYMIKKSVGADQ